MSETTASPGPSPLRGGRRKLDAIIAGIEGRLAAWAAETGTALAALSGKVTGTAVDKLIRPVVEELVQPPDGYAAGAGFLANAGLLGPERSYIAWWQGADPGTCRRPGQLQPQLHQPIRQGRMVPDPGGNRPGPRHRALRRLPLHRRIRPDLHAPGFQPPGRAGRGNRGDGRHRTAAGARGHARPAADRETGHAGHLRRPGLVSAAPDIDAGDLTAPGRAAASTPWAGGSGSGVVRPRSDHAPYPHRLLRNCRFEPLIRAVTEHSMVDTALSPRSHFPKTTARNV